MVPVVLLAIGCLLVVGGIALLSIPAALIVAGLAMVSVALFVDFENLTKKGGRRG